MASTKFKPTEKPRHNKNHTTNNHEPSLSDKVKDVAHSARKLFQHREPDHTQKPTSNSSSGAKKNETKKKKMEKHPEEQEKHCMPKMIDRVKNLKPTKNKE